MPLGLWEVLTHPQSEYHFFRDDVRLASMLISMSISMAMSLGMHQRPQRPHFSKKHTKNRKELDVF